MKAEYITGIILCNDVELLSTELYMGTSAYKDSYVSVSVLWKNYGF